MDLRVEKWKQKTKKEEQDQLIRLLESGSPYHADKEASARKMFPRYPVNMPGAGRESLTGLGEKAGQAFGTSQARFAAERGAGKLQKHELEQQKQMEEIADSRQARKFAQVDRFQKTTDWFVKILGQDDLAPQTKQNVIKAMNEFDRTVLEYNGKPRYGIGDNAATVKEKRTMGMLEYFQNHEWKTFSDDPTEGNAARAQSAITKMKNQKIDVDIYKDAVNKRMTDVRTVEATKVKTARGPSTLEERKEARLVKATSKIQDLAKKDPNAAYKRGWQMNDDGTVVLDMVTGGPQKLKSFTEVMGKRGMVLTVKKLGEQWDDAQEISGLLQDPGVMQNLQSAQQNPNLWDRVKGKWGNQIRTWMAKKGIGKNTKTYKVIAKLGEYASVERNRMLGTAVTDTELETTKSWMINPGDSLEQILTKVGIANEEGEQEFRRFLDLYKNEANMTPFYEAFGMKRFGGQGGSSLSEMSDKELLKQLGAGG